MGWSKKKRKKLPQVHCHHCVYDSFPMTKADAQKWDPSDWNLQTSAVWSSSSSSHYMHEIHFCYWNIDRCSFLRRNEIPPGGVFTETAGKYCWILAMTFPLCKNHKTHFVSLAIGCLICLELLAKTHLKMSNAACRARRWLRLLPNECGNKLDTHHDGLV